MVAGLVIMGQRFLHSTMSDASSHETTPSSQPRRSWGDTVKVYAEPASLRMLALGFSAGLPLLLVLGTLSFWLREAGINRTTIGYLSSARQSAKRSGQR